jgi:hypothetical protein
VEWLLLAGILVVAGLVIWGGVRAFQRRPRFVGEDPTRLTFDPELMHRVKELAVRNQRIPAIVLLRSAHPTLGLAAAKAIVDRLATSRPTPQPAETAPSRSPVPLEIELEARALKSDGNQRDAVELVQESTGWTPGEAKDFVDRL